MAPAELENLLLSHVAIADCGVIGLPDEEAGELPYAWVVLKAGGSLTEKELQEWVAGRRKYICNAFEDTQALRAHYVTFLFGRVHG